MVGAEIVVAGRTYVTDRRGEVRISVIPGSIELTVVKEGFAPDGLEFPILSLNP